MLGAAGCHRAAGAKGRASAGSPAALASARLTDQDGDSRQFADFQGKTVVLSFFFASCPSVCPRETRALAEVQNRLSPALKRRVQFVSFSVDPDNDSPEKLKSFAEANGANLDGWSFVRASASDTTALTRELEVFGDPKRAEAAPVGHGTSIYLFDGRGHLMQRYAGSSLDVPRLAREIAQLDDWLRTQEPERNTARL
jgi:protein SCO1/2